MNMVIPNDYIERIYAGVLGKIVGVYLGRPIEGWSHADIESKLGEIWYYVNEQRGMPLVVTDDDISGTFTFLRALADNDYDPNLTPEQIGNAWLNYIIENKTILWWGGMGRSTEHTAYLRLKAGIPAPRSGSEELNGKVVAEQIGAQIFIDGWGMVCPGDPARAVDFARRAASVSHDGEAIYGAQVVAAMEALAFVESDIPTLICQALAFIPEDCVIRHTIDDIIAWRAETPDDWRGTFAKIAATYGYDKFGGGCHMVPNHALIIHALLHGDGDFQKSLMIVNTCGWDTDCNSGNVGCLLGIRGGLAALDSGPDFRRPVADRLYLPTADGGRCVTDAVQETYAIARAGLALARHPMPDAPKNGARFHFSLPGSVQGWRELDTPDSRGTIASVVNADGRLAICYKGLAHGRVARAATDTFIGPENLKLGHYGLYSSPTLAPGQDIQAIVASAFDADAEPIAIRLFVQVYNANDELEIRCGPPRSLAPGSEIKLEWHAPRTEGFPIARVGIEIASASGKRADGTITVDSLSWTGVPETLLGPTAGGSAWQRAWVPAIDHFERTAGSLRLIQNQGAGIVTYGCREWTDYRVEATLALQMAPVAGLAVRVQGLRRYYALLLNAGAKLQLVRARDGETSILTEVGFESGFGPGYPLALESDGNFLRGYVGESLVLTATDTSPKRLSEGAIGIVLDTGNLTVSGIRLRPLNQDG